MIINVKALIEIWKLIARLFKVSTSKNFGPLTSKSYLLDDTCRHQPPVQYVKTIIQNNISCNIVNVIN